MVTWHSGHGQFSRTWPHPPIAQRGTLLGPIISNIHLLLWRYSCISEGNALFVITGLPHQVDWVDSQLIQFLMSSNPQTQFDNIYINRKNDKSHLQLFRLRLYLLHIRGQNLLLSLGSSSTLSVLLSLWIEKKNNWNGRATIKCYSLTSAIWAESF